MASGIEFPGPGSQHPISASHASIVSQIPFCNLLASLDYPCSYLVLRVFFCNRPASLVYHCAQPILLIHSCPMAPSSQQQKISPGPKREAVLVNPQVHALQPLRTLQGYHIASLLVHPGKIVSRYIDKRVMGCEHNMLCRHCPPGRLYPSVIHFQHLCLFIDFHFLCHFCQEFQRMEPGLLFKSCDACHWERKLTFRLERCPYAQRPGHFCFPFQKPWMILGIQVCRTSDKIACNSFFQNQPFIFSDSPLICHGIMFCHPASKGPDQPVIDQIVLGSDFGRGILRLPAAYPVCLQDHCPDARLLQIICCQNPRKSCPYDNSRYFHVPCKGVTPLDPGIFHPY